MRDAFGKSCGTCAQVNIGQILLSIRCKAKDHVATALEALKRAKFKILGRQKIIKSLKWGFTHFTKENYFKWKNEDRLFSCGSDAKFYNIKYLNFERILSSIFIHSSYIGYMTENFDRNYRDNFY